MWMTGHSFIKRKMKESGAALAGEMSGHMFFGPPDYLGFDDALYAAARLLKIIAGQPRPLAALRAELPQYVSTPEIRVDCPEDKKFEIVRRAQEWFASRYDAVTVDGVRVTFPDGWGLVRASNTQPLLVLRFEALSEGRLAEIQALVTDKVEALKREVGA